MGIPFLHAQTRDSYQELGRGVGEAACALISGSGDFIRENYSSMTAGRLGLALTLTPVG